MKAAGKKMENLVKEFISDASTQEFVAAHDLPELVPEVQKKKNTSLFMLGAFGLLIVGILLGAF